MADDIHARRASIGMTDHSNRDGYSRGETAASALAALWVVLAGGYFLLFGSAGQDGLRIVLMLLTVFVPGALLGVAATTLRAMRVMSAESARLQAAVDALRHAHLAQSQVGRPDPQVASIARKMDELLKREQRPANAAPAPESDAMAKTPDTAPEPAPEAAAADDQASFALGTASEDARQLSNADFIRALDFPRTAEDREGFNALRRAFRDRPAAQLVQSAQDVLTLLSEEGVYMDDLAPDRARPETWRRFAQGVRGREVSALGGIRDETALERTSARMRDDPIFRDAAHHFLRLYDRAIVRFDAVATDAEIADFSDTRSSRAFMLLGRVAGAFDGPQGS